MSYGENESIRSWILTFPFKFSDSISKTFEKYCQFEANEDENNQRTRLIQMVICQAQVVLHRCHGKPLENFTWMMLCYTKDINRQQVITLSILFALLTHCFRFLLFVPIEIIVGRAGK